MKLRADRRVGVLLGGALLATLVAMGATVALPATDPSLDVKPVELNEAEARGMEIYRREGLWQCAASYSRETLVESGEATTPTDVAGLNPVMLGLENIGDLCGVALSDDDTAAVEAFLASR